MELGSFEVGRNSQVLDVSPAGVVSYQVDPSSTSGLVSRWNLAFHLMKKVVTYSERASQSATSLVFYRPVGDQAVSIVGSPQAFLSMALEDGTDAAVFVYLEERNGETGWVNYITEGALRLAHRGSPGASPAPGRSRARGGRRRSRHSRPGCIWCRGRPRGR